MYLLLYYIAINRLISLLFLSQSRDVRTFNARHDMLRYTGADLRGDYFALQGFQPLFGWTFWTKYSTFSHSEVFNPHLGGLKRYTFWSQPLSRSLKFWIRPWSQNYSSFNFHFTYLFKSYGDYKISPWCTYIQFNPLRISSLGYGMDRYYSTSFTTYLSNTSAKFTAISTSREYCCFSAYQKDPRGCDCVH